MNIHTPALWKLALIGASLSALLLGGCVSAPEKEEPKEKKVLVFPSPPDEPRFYFERAILGTNSVTKRSEEDKLKSWLTGVNASSDGIGFAKPFDVAVHKGRVFVSDSVARGVFALDFVESRWFRVGNNGDEGDIQSPLGLATDDAGNLYVVDMKLKTVLVYDRDGKFLFRAGSRKIMDRPTGIDVTPDGSRIFVVDVGGVRSTKHMVHVFDGKTGEHLRDIGKRGKGELEFNLPRDVAVGDDGLLYITDGGNFRVQVVTQDGKFVRQWGKPGRHLGEFTRAKGIAMGPDGNIYVVDAAFGNFQIFNKQGQLLLFIGGRSEQNRPSTYMLPAGITVDEDGRVLIVGQFFKKIEVYRPANLQKTDGYLRFVPEES